MLDDIDLFISENGKVYRYLLNNANFESRVMLVKLDKETGNTVPLAGHGYKLFDPQGKQITMTLTYPEIVEIDTFYTDAHGYLITPEPLPYGESYSAVEVQAVEPYVLDPTPVYFDILPESAEEVDGVTVIKVEKENMPQKGHHHRPQGRRGVLRRCHHRRKRRRAAAVSTGVFHQGAGRGQV